MCAVLALLCAACGDASASVDAARDAAPDAPMPPALEIAAPADPALPILTPCPAGWTEEDRAGAVACTPYATGAPAACDDGFVHLPGDPGCVRLGTACPAGGMPDELPADATVWFVREGASGDGTTAASPLGSIGEALALAPDGAIIAIGEGTYDEVVRITRPITLWGACPLGVLLTSSAPSPALDGGVVVVESAGVTVRNLSVGQSARPGIWATVPSAGLTLLDVIVAGAETIAVAVEQRATLDATGLIVRDTRPGASGMFGRGLGVESGATAHVRRALFERNHEFNVIVMHAATSVTVEDAVLRDGIPRVSNGRDGIGLSALRGGSARLLRAWVAGNTAGGVTALDAGSQLELEDVWVSETRAQADGAFGRGLNVEAGAAAIGRRLVLTGNREAGALAHELGTTLRIEDAIIERTLPRVAGGEFGRGVATQLGATTDLARVVIDQNVESGISAIGDGATLTMQDIVVRRTEAGIGGIGRGLTVETGAVVVASRVLVEDSAGAGVVVQSAGASLAMEDARIRRTAGVDAVLPARAIGVQRQALARFARLVLEDNAQFGAIVIHEGSRLDLTDLLVTGTREHPCDSCVRGGTALGVFGGGALDATRFAVRGADLCGVHVGTASAMDLADGEITECLLGACVQSDGYDLERLSRDVRYHDNVTNLDTTTLPVPDAVPGLPPS